jgi:hypothetical protein
LAGSLLCGAGSCVIPEEELLDEDQLATTEHQITYNGHDYLFVTSPATWDQAQTHCANYTSNTGGGYHLVTINDAAEESFLNTSETSRGFSRWWIGYTDRGAEGSWIWPSGTSTYTNWAVHQPDNSREQDCAVDRFDGVDGWDDQPCEWTNRFICERDGLSVENKGVLNYSATATASATVNTATKSVHLLAGQLFTMGTCGIAGASANGDTWIRLRNPSGTEIASNDDAAFCGVGSSISITVATTGTHIIHAGCYTSSSCSGTVAFGY